MALRPTLFLEFELRPSPDGNSKGKCYFLFCSSLSPTKKGESINLPLIPPDLGVFTGDSGLRACVHAPWTLDLIPPGAVALTTQYNIAENLTHANADVVYARHCEVSCVPRLIPLSNEHVAGVCRLFLLAGSTGRGFVKRKCHASLSETGRACRSGEHRGDAERHIAREIPE